MPFANTAPELRRGIEGCPAIGGREATDAKYAGAMRLGHTVVPVIFDFWGLRGWRRRPAQ